MWLYSFVSEGGTAPLTLMGIKAEAGKKDVRKGVGVKHLFAIRLCVLKADNF